VLAENLPPLIAGIKFGETMRWNRSGIYFSRPIRWIVALIGDAVIPFEYAGVTSGRVTRGTRPTGSPDLPAKNPADYLNAVQASGILLSREERRTVIWAHAQKLAAEVGGTIPRDEGLLDEVANLIEQPTVLRGTFERRFLDLPHDVLITVMRKHQRYFGVEDDQGRLLPYFIAVRNGDAEHLDEVIRGNEHVLTARFSDADFFFRDDRQHRLTDRKERLKTMTFQEKLGSIWDKNERLVKAVKPFGKLLDLDAASLRTAQAAAALAKTDQATRMVVEMTSLEGVMGREYALLEGQPQEVADAILEHYRPDASGPRPGPAGTLLALADRLDSLVGLYAVGLAPTAAADPFAMRRAALGVVQILLNGEIDLDLREAIQIVAKGQPVPVSDDVQRDVLAFIAGRLRVYMLDELGLAYDSVEAVLAEQSHNPYRALIGVRELLAWVQRPDWSAILDSFARCVRITRDQPAYKLKAAALTPAESVALYEAARQAQGKLTARDNVDACLSAFEPLVPTITKFFDSVLVMDENPAIRENRLALLQYVTSLSKGRADLSKLSGF
jgi:glycyl-tRNA synthetase